MSFNPYPSKQVQEVIFSWKINKVYHPPLLFNNTTAQQISTQNIQGHHHNNEKVNKTNKDIGIICKPNNIFSFSALLTIYRSFVRSYLDYGDVIYDQPENESFSSKIEYNESLAIAVAIRGIQQEKLYQELGLVLKSRKWLMRVCYFYKLIKTQKPLYLFYLIPPNLNSLRHQLRDAKTIVLKITLELMSQVVREWNKLSTEICNLTSGKKFRKMLLSFIKPT